MNRLVQTDLASTQVFKSLEYGYIVFLTDLSQKKSDDVRTERKRIKMTHNSICSRTMSHATIEKMMVYITNSRNSSILNFRFNGSIS